MELVYKFARAHQHDTEGAYVIKNQRAPAEAALRAALADKDAEIAALKEVIENKDRYNTRLCQDITLKAQTIHALCDSLAAAQAVQHAGRLMDELGAQLDALVQQAMPQAGQA